MSMLSSTAEQTGQACSSAAWADSGSLLANWFSMASSKALMGNKLVGLSGLRERLSSRDCMAKCLGGADKGGS